MREQAWLGLMVLLGIILGFTLGYLRSAYDLRGAVYVERYDLRGGGYGPYIGKCAQSTDGLSVYCAKTAGE